MTGDDTNDAHSDGDYGRLAFLAFVGTDGRLAEGFRDVANLVVRHWEEDEVRQVHGDDPLAVAVLYNYRHALELAYKDALTCAFEITGEERKLAQTHSLRKLHSWLEECLAHDRISPSIPSLESEEGVADLVAELDRLDPTGQSFRYTKMKTKAGARHALPNEVLDIVAVSKRINHVLDMLDGLATGLDEVLPMHQEMAEQAYWNS